MKILKSKRLLAWVILIMGVIYFIDFYGIRLLRSHGLLARWVSVKDLSHVETENFNHGALGELAKIFKGNDPKELLKDVMNSVSKVGCNPSGNTIDFYYHAKQGGGLNCYGMSKIFYSVLRLNNIKSRIVSVARNLTDMLDSHTTVEVFIHGKWIIFDPTFNVSFKKNGMMIGAQEIYDALFDGSHNQIKPVFYGEVMYPARLEKYYMHWLPLFNNVFIEIIPHGTLTKIPPFRYWIGPVHYLKQAPHGSFSMCTAFYNGWYFLFIVVLPVILFINFGLFSIVLLSQIRLGGLCNREEAYPFVYRKFINTVYYLKRVLSLPLYIIVKKMLGKFTCKVRTIYHRQYDFRFPTFAKEYSSSQGKLNRFFQPVPVELLHSHTSWINAVTEQYLSHHFDLLGSGWMQVKHGMKCMGVEGHKYNAGSAIIPDREGRWLEGRINKANLTESKCIWRLIDEDYIPIDWHLDFKSGYRWSEDIWYRDVPYGHKPGVDIKVPWELARMQHLPQLVWAYALSKGGYEGFRQHEVYSKEFCNQVLDFIANNPPRFGVNWSCAMDVGIRVANWLVAYDLFRAYGVEFDKKFESVFMRSIYEHGLHIVNNLEWSAELHGNHYLSNIVGLLFVSAYLPCTPETDIWLAFAVQELMNEVKYQFTQDGANFEASTSYHRLAAEMVVYGTALIMALPSEKLAALKDYNHQLHRFIPELRPAPMLLYPLQGSEEKTPFPVWYIEKLEKMGRFTMHSTRPDQHITQLGDNDNGRFLKLQPTYQNMTIAEAKIRYSNLDGYTVLPNDAAYWYEDHTNHCHLVAAINGLFQQHDFADFTGNEWFEYIVVKSLCNGKIIPYQKTDLKEPINSYDDVKLYQYPGFGLYIYRSKFLYLTVRCGHIGQNGRGGHAHNDQLSFELAADGSPIFVDPGTYLYTPLPDKRNLFRATAMHNTLILPEKEQNNWLAGRLGLFEMSNQSVAKVIEINKNKFLGEHRGFGPTHRRLLEIHEEYIDGLDECDADGERYISFHLAPDTRVDNVIYENNGIDLYSGGVKVRLRSKTGKWDVQESFYSPAYGVIQKCQLVRLQGTTKSVHWSIKLER